LYYFKFALEKCSGGQKFAGKKHLHIAVGYVFILIYYKNVFVLLKYDLYLYIH